MKPTRMSRILTISLPPKLYAQSLKWARAHGMTRSELFREALRRFEKGEEEWQGILAYGRRKALETGVRSEEDVERLIDESRT
ncbi:MAG: ribbon-helix-helix protein, CopG family [Elusimicrobia bacterium]|nr:ribbon-helix-helix protein, CopG family [Candidatus Obscuribacterium magneticum]